MAMAEQLDAEVREIQKPAAVLACIQCAIDTVLREMTVTELAERLSVSRFRSL
jgi:hypothetical protein